MTSTQFDDLRARSFDALCVAPTKELIVRVADFRLKLIYIQDAQQLDEWARAQEMKIEQPRAVLHYGDPI